LKKTLINILFSILLIPALSFVTEAQYWQKVTNIPAPYNNAYWLDVDFFPGNNLYGWACGFNGRVLRTTDGGITWSGSTIPTIDMLESINFPTLTTGYVSGPAGIYKTTDGGVTWADVTPATAGSLWGSNFYDADNGVLVGGGCVSQQEFWRTTNGGLSWTLFSTLIPNSGLTHVLMNSTGPCYAVSSGRLWISNDQGFTWSVLSITGSEIWEEDISHTGNSFLLPAAGTDCQGGGPGGGMRFSIDGGTTWRTYTVPSAIFGTFITSTTTGWACGYDMGIYYTSDAGVTWGLRNCGVEQGHLDDMYFFSDNDGWAVGQGVYKLAPSTQIVTKNCLEFPETCINSPRLDTFSIKNFSNSQITASYFLTGANSSEFAVITPAMQTFNINPCDSQKVIVQFNPTSIGNKIANIKITILNGPEFHISLTGYASQSTAKLSDTLVIIDPAPCGVKSKKAIMWTASSDFDFVNSVQYSSGSKDITLNTAMPLKITALGVETGFEITPKDTGWFVTRFRATLTPCNRDTFLTVKAYGKSPIVNTPFKSESLVNCQLSLKDTVVVCNTGNDDLVIKKASINDINSGYKINRWSSGQVIPVTITPGKCDSIILDFQPAKPAIDATKLRLETNDATTARGNKAIVEVNLNGNILSTMLAPVDTVLDFGEACINDTLTLGFYIKNYGNISAAMAKPQNKRNEFPSFIQSANYPVGINAGDSGFCKVIFSPKTVGTFNDTILLISWACNDTLRIYAKGSSTYSSLNSTPQSVQGIVFTSQLTSKTVIVNNNGLTDLKITNLDFLNLPQSWIASFNPALPVDLKPGDSVKFVIDFLTQIDTILDTKICVKATGKCPAEICIPVNLTSSSRSVEVQPDFIDFGETHCHPKYFTSDLKITNSGVIQDTLIRVELSGTSFEFKILNPPTLPYIIDKGGSISLSIGFTASVQGVEKTELIVESSNMRGKEIRIQMLGAFMLSDTLPLTAIMNFDTIEKCQSRIEKTYWFHNRGNLADTFVITRPALEYGFGIEQLDKSEPNDRLILKPSDSSGVKIFCEPVLFTNTGKYAANYTFTGTVCGAENTLIAEVEVIEPVLEFDEQTLSFGSIWKDDSLDKKLTIYNHFPLDETITGWKFTQDLFRIVNTPVFPSIILPNDSLSLIVRFNATKAGVSTDTLLIVSTTRCRDTSSVFADAKVPAEIYLAKVFIDDYTFSPGEAVEFAVKLDSAMPRVKPTQIDWQIDFDKWLFLPANVLIKNGAVSQNLPFNYSYGTLTGSVTGTEAENLFSKPGDMFYITGQTLYSTPATTPLTISKFDLTTKQTVEITKKDGSLTVYPVCSPIGALHMQLFTKNKFTLKNQVIDNGTLDIGVTDLDAGSYAVNIYDLPGNSLYQNAINIKSGINDYRLSIPEINSGVYQISISSGSSVLFRGGFVVVK